MKKVATQSKFGLHPETLHLILNLSIQPLQVLSLSSRIFEIFSLMNRVHWKIWIHINFVLGGHQPPNGTPARIPKS